MAMSFEDYDRRVRELPPISPEEKARRIEALFKGTPFGEFIEWLKSV